MFHRKADRHRTKEQLMAVGFASDHAEVRWREGESAQTASPIVATRDPAIVRVVANAIAARLNPKPGFGLGEPQRRNPRHIAGCDQGKRVPPADSEPTGSGR